MHTGSAYTAPSRRATASFWIAVLLLCLLAVPAALQARGDDLLTGAEKVISHADAYGARRQFDDAISLLREATQRYPTYARLYLSLATWQEVRGLFNMTTSSGSLDKRKELLRRNLRDYTDVVEELFNTYGLAMMYVPDTREVRKRVADLTVYDYPLRVGEYGPVALPGSPTAFTYTLNDPRLPAEVRGVRQGLITAQPLPAPERYQKDPKYTGNADYARKLAYRHKQFDYMLLAYAYQPEQRRWHLRFRVMWQDMPGQREERTELACQTARLLLRLSWLAEAYADLTPRFTQDRVLNVWLSEFEEAGGEAYDDNIYLHKVSVYRPPAEWLREVAHEYGHQTFPAVGGYTRPEWGANGFLGEKLYMRWLARNPESLGESHPWLMKLDPVELQETRINPLIRKFADLGPEMPQIRGKDAAAMDAFLGMALYLEAAHGGKMLADALRAMTTPAYTGPNGFLESVEGREAYAQSSEHAVVSLNLCDLPRDITLWVYLRDGVWQGQLKAWDNMMPDVKVDVDGKAVLLTDGAFTTAELKQGWHRLRVTAGGGDAADLTGVDLLRL